ncbi:hypothetical protein FRB99_003985 [Tulasnella sp. 403]|nr:hypothetical protein FRB99_003985 [Tulasnella sp. 403]
MVAADRRPPYRVLARADSSTTGSSSSHSYGSSSQTPNEEPSSSALTTPDGSSRPTQFRSKSPQPAFLPAQALLELDESLGVSPPVATPSKGKQKAKTEDGPNVWKLEFRGVVKLVRWVSSKGSKKATPSNTNPPHATDPLAVSPPPTSDHPSPPRTRSISSRFPSISKRGASPAAGASVPAAKLSRGRSLLQTITDASSSHHLTSNIPNEDTESHGRLRPPAVSGTSCKKAGKAQASTVIPSNRDGSASCSSDPQRNALETSHEVHPKSETLVLHDNETLRASSTHHIKPAAGSLDVVDTPDPAVALQRLLSRKELRRTGVPEFKRSLSPSEDPAPLPVTSDVPVADLHSTIPDPVTSVSGPIRDLSSPTDIQSVTLHDQPPLSPDSTAFSHSQGLPAPATSDTTHEHLNMVRMTYSDLGHGTSASSYHHSTFSCGDDLYLATSDCGHSSPRTTALAHLHTVSEVGHGGSSGRHSGRVSQPGTSKHARTHPDVPRRSATMGKSDRVRRNNSGSSRKSSRTRGGSIKRKGSNKGPPVTVADKLKRSLSLRKSFTNISFSVLSEVRLRGGTHIVEPKLLNKNRRESLEAAAVLRAESSTPNLLSKRRSTIFRPEKHQVGSSESIFFDEDAVIVSPPTNSKPLPELPSPPVLSPLQSPLPLTDERKLPSTPLTPPRSLSHPPSTPDSPFFGRGATPTPNSTPPVSGLRLPPTYASEKAGSTATLPVSLNRKPSEGRKLQKRRGGSVGNVPSIDALRADPSDFNRVASTTGARGDQLQSGSFVSNLAGALAGLGLTTSSSGKSRSRDHASNSSKPPKHSPYPPSTWRCDSASRSTSALPSTLGSPFQTAPPSPETDFTHLSESPTIPTVSLGYNGTSGPPRSKSVKLMSSGKGSWLQPGSTSTPASSLAAGGKGGEKLRKRRSKPSIERFTPIGDVPPVPAIPASVVASQSPHPHTNVITLQASPISLSPLSPHSSSRPISPPAVTVTPPVADTAHVKRPPLASLAYTGRYGYYVQEGNKVQLRPPAAGGMHLQPGYSTVKHHLSSLERTSIDENRQMDNFDAAPTTRLYTSPSSPNYAPADMLPTSIYESRLDGRASLGDIARPLRPLIPHRPSSSSAQRWSLAVNHIADDSEFLREIDELRKARTSRDRSSSIDEFDVLEGTSRGQSTGSRMFDIQDNEDVEMEDVEGNDNAAGGEESDEEVVWMKARRAMLCVREIMRTETSYRGHLLNVWEAESASPSGHVPPLFMNHLPSLISASSALSRFWEEDPSAWGVSATFLNVEQELEVALVSWCSVVGQVMLELTNGGSSMAIGMRASLYYRKYGSGTKDKDADKDKAPKRSDTAGSGGSSSSQTHSKQPKPKKEKASRPPSSTSSTVLSVATSTASKPLGIQDIVIMPSQRVPRYVLLFRDLLQQTPATSPSRALVERALEGAMRIAKRCDETQQHIGPAGSS